jgi:hypothetical protein
VVPLWIRFRCDASLSTYATIAARNVHAEAARASEGPKNVGTVASGKETMLGSTAKAMKSTQASAYSLRPSRPGWVSGSSRWLALPLMDGPLVSAPWGTRPQTEPTNPRATRVRYPPFRARVAGPTEYLHTSKHSRATAVCVPATAEANQLAYTSVPPVKSLPNQAAAASHKDAVATARLRRR